MPKNQTFDFARDLANFKPKQVEALEKLFDPKTKYLLYGGAAHGGKSYFLRWSAIALGMYYSQKYQIKAVPIGLFSEDYPTLKDRQVSRIKREFPEWLGTLKEGRDEGYMFEAHPQYGGFQVLLRNLDDPSKYASSEFAAILVEELTKNPEETFEDLRFRLRYKGVDDPKFVGCTNPGGIGHGWVKKFWIEPDPRNPDLEADRFVFVRSLPTDNPYTTKEYLTQLKSLPEQKRKAFLYGSWDVFEGQVFTEWNRDDHVVQPFTIPKEWNKYIALDWGVNNPFSVGWYAQDNDGRTYKYRELYMTGQEFEHKFNAPMTPKRLARVILALTNKNEEQYQYCVADPSIWNSIIYKSKGFTDKDFDEGESIAEIMMEQGLNLIKADNDRLNGLARFREALAIAPDGKPWFQVFSSCYHTIRTIPALVYDTRRVEDVNSRGEDHCLHGDTLILTNNAWIPIKKLPFAKITGYDATVIDLISESGRKITCTKNHKILTPSGWKEAGSLKIGEEILLLSQIPFKNSWEEDFINADITTVGSLKSSQVVKEYIRRYGNFITERFQKPTMSTTSTEIEATTQLKTLKSSKRGDTLVIIPLTPQANSEKPEEIMPDYLPQQVIKSSPGSNVVERVKWVGNERKVGKVYDLGVEHWSHSFVANGFVVHNSYDEARYYFMSRPTKTFTITKTETSPIRQHYLSIMRRYADNEEANTITVH